MTTESGDAARRAARAAKGRAYGLFILAAVGAALCVGISHQNPAALAVGAVLVVVSAVVVSAIERRLRVMDPARRSRLVSAAGFAGLAVALVFPFLLPPEWSIVIAGPAVGGLVALGLVMLRRGRLPAPGARSETKPPV
jgi:Kef-type K+ transport system membrane component KefB